MGRDSRVNLVVEPADKREALLASFPAAVFALGGWTRLGYVAIDLAAIDDALLGELVQDAWLDAQPAKKTRQRAR